LAAGFVTLAVGLPFGLRLTGESLFAAGVPVKGKGLNVVFV
jgi:hypothetical protein